MSHENHGHYAAKHPGKQINPMISDELKKSSNKGDLNCINAHKIAEKLGVTPDEIGIQADLSELCISRCQMGLFGYFPQKKRLDPNISIPPKLETALDKVQTQGRISCAQCWNLASELGIPKMDIGSACEKKGIRIKPCQLGAF